MIELNYASFLDICSSKENLSRTEIKRNTEEWFRNIQKRVERICDKTRGKWKKEANFIPETHIDVYEMICWTIINTWLSPDPHITQEYLDNFGINVSDLITNKSNSRGASGWGGITSQGEDRTIYGGFVRDYIIRGIAPNDIDVQIGPLEGCMSAVIPKQDKNSYNAWAQSMYESLYEQLQFDWSNAFNLVIGSAVDGEGRLFSNINGDCCLVRSTGEGIGMNLRSIQKLPYGFEISEDDRKAGGIGNYGIHIDMQVKNFSWPKSMPPGISSDIDSLSITKEGLKLKNENLIDKEWTPFSKIYEIIYNTYKNQAIYYYYIDNPVAVERVTRLLNRNVTVCNLVFREHTYFNHKELVDLINLEVKRYSKSKFSIRRPIKLNAGWETRLGTYFNIFLNVDYRDFVLNEETGEDMKWIRPSFKLDESKQNHPNVKVINEFHNRKQFPSSFSRKSQMIRTGSPEGSPKRDLYQITRTESQEDLPIGADRLSDDRLLDRTKSPEGRPKRSLHDIFSDLNTYLEEKSPMSTSMKEDVNSILFGFICLFAYMNREMIGLSGGSKRKKKTKRKRKTKTKRKRKTKRKKKTKRKNIFGGTLSVKPISNIKYGPSRSKYPLGKINNFINQILPKIVRRTDFQKLYLSGELDKEYKVDSSILPILIKNMNMEVKMFLQKIFNEYLGKLEYKNTYSFLLLTFFNYKSLKKNFPLINEYISPDKDSYMYQYITDTFYFDTKEYQILNIAFKQIYDNNYSEISKTSLKNELEDYEKHDNVMLVYKLMIKEKTINEGNGLQKCIGELMKIL